MNQKWYEYFVSYRIGKVYGNAQIFAKYQYSTYADILQAEDEIQKNNNFKERPLILNFILMGRVTPQEILTSKGEKT